MKNNKNKYEPENMSSWLKMRSFCQFIKDWDFPEGIVGTCSECEKQVREGEGIRLANSFRNYVWHRNCFVSAKEYLGQFIKVEGNEV